MYSTVSIKCFLQELSSEAPYPGGGSAACLVASIGISLARMVGAILEKKKKKNSKERTRLAKIRRCLHRLSQFNMEALRAMDGDVKVYKKVVKAYSLPKGTPGRVVKIQRALRGGYLFQKNFALLILEASKLLRFLEQSAEGSIASDLILSKYFLKAGFLGACQTAKINLKYMKDNSFKQKEAKVLTSLVKRMR